MKLPEPRVTAVPLTSLVGVVVVVVVGGADGPDPTGPFTVLCGGVAPNRAGWVVVDAATDGDVRVGTVVVGAVPTVFGCRVLPVLEVDEALCGDSDVDVGAPTDGDAREGGLASLGICGTYPLARTGLGVLGGLSGSRATDTRSATMPTTEAAPIPFFRRWMFISHHIDRFCRLARTRPSHDFFPCTKIGSRVVTTCSALDESSTPFCEPRPRLEDMTTRSCHHQFKQRPCPSAYRLTLTCRKGGAQSRRHPERLPPLRGCRANHL